LKDGDDDDTLAGGTKESHEKSQLFKLFLVTLYGGTKKHEKSELLKLFLVILAGGTKKNHKK
jgi:hypothetical protein